MRSPNRMEIVGRGTTACVIRKAPGAGAHLTKILTNPAEAEDKAVLAALRALDPEGMHFVIGSDPELRAPTAAERAIVQECKRDWRMVGDKLDPAAPEMAFIDMMDGGPTLSRISGLIDDQKHQKLPFEQGVKLAIDVIDAVLRMHGAGYAHNDLHIHNVVVQGFPSHEGLHARLIDFGKTQRGITHVQVQKDADGLRGILAKIVYATDDSIEHKWNCFRREVGLPNKGNAKMPIKADIRKCIDVEADPLPSDTPRHSKKPRQFFLDGEAGPSMGGPGKQLF